MGASRKRTGRAGVAGRPRKVCTLRRALAYENRHVVRGFMTKYAVSLSEAKSLFNETKKYLWLSAVAIERGMPLPIITNEIVVIDEMWHNFVLFTKEYRDYCDDCYGFYVDHGPATGEEIERGRRAFRADPVSWQATWDAQLREQLSFVYEELGRKTVLKWYQTFPRRYSLVRLEQLRRKQADRMLGGRKRDVGRRAI
jgi:hypothetical protein